MIKNPTLGEMSKWHATTSTTWRINGISSIRGLGMGKKGNGRESSKRDPGARRRRTTIHDSRETALRAFENLRRVQTRFRRQQGRDTHQSYTHPSAPAPMASKLFPLRVFLSTKTVTRSRLMSFSEGGGEPSTQPFQPFLAAERFFLSLGRRGKGGSYGPDAEVRSRTSMSRPSPTPGV